MNKIVWLAGVALAFGITQTAYAGTYAGVTMRIETVEGTVYDNTVYVSDHGCTVVDNLDVEHELTGLNALCALDAAAQDGDFTYSISYYEGSGFFLNAIGDIENAFDFSEYWGSYLNFASMTASLDATVIGDGDEIVLSYGSYLDITPLRLQLSTAHVVAGKTVVATVDYLSTDWMTMESVYVPLKGAVITVGESTYITDEQGEVEMTINDVGTHVVRTTADGYTRSVGKLMKVYPVHPDDDSAHSAHYTSTEQSVREAVAYLSASAIDGVIGGSIANTEWAAQAISKARTEYGNEVINESVFAEIVNVVLAYRPKAADGASEVARHILTLEALGFDSRDMDGVNYVRRLKNTMSNYQFGDETLCNDDIFAGLALVSADERLSSKALRRAMLATLSCQNEDGGFGYSVTSESETDTTAAWLMLAGNFRGKNHKHHIAMKGYRVPAFEYMKRAQHPDGGWGYNLNAASNSSSTAWAMMGYSAHHFFPEERQNNKYSGIDFVSSVQGRKGGVQYNSEKDSSIVELNTAFTIMSLLGKAIGQ